MNNLIYITYILLFYPIYIKFLGKDSVTTGTIYIFVFFLIFLLKFKDIKKRFKFSVTFFSIVGIFSVVLSGVDGHFLQNLRYYIYFLSSLLLFFTIYNYLKIIGIDKANIVLENIITIISILMAIEVLIGILILIIPNIGKIFSIFTPRNIESIEPIINKKSIFRIRGIILGGEGLGEALAVFFPFVLYKSVSSKEIIFKLIIGIFVLGELLTLTRSSILLMSITLFIFLILFIKKGYINKILILSFILFIFFIIFYSIRQDFIDSLIYRFSQTLYLYKKIGINYDTINRDRFYYVIPHVINNLSVFGNGMIVLYGGSVYNYHNLYLNWLYKFGILGFIGLILFFIKILLKLWKSVKIFSIMKAENLRVFASFCSLIIFLINELKYEFNRGASYQPIVWSFFAIYLISAEINYSIVFRKKY